MRILITGCAGFIGFHFSKKMLNEGHKVIGLDNLNNYYDIKLKKARIDELKKICTKFPSNFIFEKVSLEDKNLLEDVFNQNEPEVVVNLAAQAGVRYSLENPSAYIQANMVGFGNILESCKKNNIKHLIYASSSSVYGGNTKVPFSEKDTVDHPVSLYAASKKSNELMAHVYSHLFELPTIGLRFFTVYGPWGRPDMALFLFTENILKGKPIQVFNNGQMVRDFTYIDDVVESMSRLIYKAPQSDQEFNCNEPISGKSWAPFKVFNVGNSNPIQLMDYIKCIEKKLGIKAKIEMKKMQPGDVPYTASDTNELQEYISYKPETTIDEGISNFVDWYKDFYE
tara:strand:+ start:4 stop:1023 length:1020 start_codon:yes stop_codon:yes gene_type:complete